MGKSSRIKWERRAATAEQSQKQKIDYPFWTLVVTVVAAVIALITLIVAHVDTLGGHSNPKDDASNHIEHRAWIALEGPIALSNGSPCQVLVDDNCHVYIAYRNVGH